MTTTDTERVADAMVTAPKAHSSDATVDVLRAFFDNGHVHMALIVDELGRLLTTVERRDIADHPRGDSPAVRLGTLEGRTVRASDPLGPVTDRLRRERLRRLAVIDEDQRLVGLLCFKRSGNGYCAEDGILARERERRSP